MNDFRTLLAFRKGMDLAMEIFEVSKRFPKEEVFSLTDQVRRSSRSVCANISEAYRKQRYPANFISKLTDSDAENSETQVWLLFALRCDYISQTQFNRLHQESIEVGNLITFMIGNPERFGVQAAK